MRFLLHLLVSPSPPFAVRASSAEAGQRHKGIIGVSLLGFYPLRRHSEICIIMAVPQLSVFLENRPGHMKRILDALEVARINVLGFSASDTGDYGIARFILDEPEAALEVLRAEGCAVTLTEVLCVHLPNRPGELARVIGAIADAGINVQYSYSLISNVITIYANDIKTTEAALQGQPIELVSLEAIALQFPSD
jgi:hypothetical protein